MANELGRLKVDMVGLSEMKRGLTVVIISEGYMHYWSGMSKGTCPKGVAIDISTLLQPFMDEVTLG